MKPAASDLPTLLATLAARARCRRMTDAQWASRAGLRKETLSRLKHRDSCDLSTLQALAKAVGSRLEFQDAHPPTTTSDGHFPATLGRDEEARLLQLAASGEPVRQAWADAGPPFFMAGLAVMLASQHGIHRNQLLALAETLHPGASEPAVFARWLARSPLRPSRFLPMLEMERKHAA